MYKKLLSNFFSHNQIAEYTAAGAYTAAGRFLELHARAQAGKHTNSIISKIINSNSYRNYLPQVSTCRRLSEREEEQKAKKLSVKRSVLALVTPKEKIVTLSVRHQKSQRYKNYCSGEPIQKRHAQMINIRAADNHFICEKQNVSSRADAATSCQKNVIYLGLKWSDKGSLMMLPVTIPKPANIISMEMLLALNPPSICSRGDYIQRYLKMSIFTSTL